MRGKYFIAGFLILVILFLTTSCSTSKILTTESDGELNIGIIDGNMERVKEAVQDGANLNSIRTSLTEKENPVMIALLKNQERIAEYLISCGADVNYTDRSGRSLLMFSAYNTDVSFCNYLIEHGADVNQEDQKGYTALEYVLDHSRKDTSENDMKEIISDLITNGAEIRSMTLEAELNGENGKTESRYDVKRIVVNGLLRQGIEPNLDPAIVASITGDSLKLADSMQGDQTDEWQQIMFFTAAFGSVDSMRLLADKGMDLNVTDWQGNTLLILASQYGNLDIVKFLVDQGYNNGTVNDDGMSALYTAVDHDHFEVAKYFIENRGYFSMDDLSKTRDILGTASANGNIDMMDFIISSGYTLNDDKLLHALYCAIGSDKLDAIDFLTKKGADVNEIYQFSSLLDDIDNLDTLKFLISRGANINGSNVRLLYWASQRGDIDIVDFLLQQGISANLIQKYSDGSGGESPLMAAAFSGEFDIVQLLVENGADVNFKYEYGDNGTALLYAASGGSRHILEYLIQNGAQIDYQDENGDTALMIAASLGNTECVKILLNYNADVSLKNSDGHTAYDLAKSALQLDIANLLEDSK